MEGRMERRKHKPILTTCKSNIRHTLYNDLESFTNAFHLLRHQYEGATHHKLYSDPDRCALTIPHVVDGCSASAYTTDAPIGHHNVIYCSNAVPFKDERLMYSYKPRKKIKARNENM